MDEIGVFSPEQARLLWQDYLRRQQAAPHVQSNYPVRRPVDEVSPHRVFVKNTSAETVPAYACMRITGVEEVGERTALLIEKPTSAAGEFVFNSQFEILPESGLEKGVGWAYRYGIVVMRGQLGIDPSESNVSYKPIVGSWEIEEGSGPFTVFGRHDSSEQSLIGRFRPPAGGVPIIRFEIITFNSVDRIAFVNVIGRPEGYSTIGSLPEELEGESLYVHDPPGCWFSEPGGELLGRQGWAVYLQSADCESCTGYPGDLLHWEVMALCPCASACPEVV